MSYRAFKRLLGETSLERKCRFLFGAFILLLITLSFWLYSRQTEHLAYDQLKTSCRLLVYPSLAQRHEPAEDQAKAHAMAEAMSEVRQAWDRLLWPDSPVEAARETERPEEQRESYLHRFIKPNDPSRKPDNSYESGLLKKFQDNPELLEEFDPRLLSRREHHYYAALRVRPSCQAGGCHAATVKGQPLHVGDLIAVLKINMKTGDIEKAIHWNRALLLSTGLVTALLIMGGSYIIVRYVIVKPVKHLKEVSDAISAGELNVRSEIQTGDEFEDLSHAFNRMLRNLVAMQDRLRKVNADLDRKVDELAQANMALYESNRLKSDFLATMSHELRTPLNSILGFSEVLQTSAGLSDKQQRWVLNIRSSGDKLLALINDILDLAKIEAGKMQVSLSGFALGDVCEGLLAMFRPMAEKKNIDLRSQVPASLPLMRQDAGKLQQILSNLLSNAIKFTPEGGRVLVSAEADALHVIITVSDTGVGIAPEEQDLVFEKFRQAANPMTREYAGTGLGLSIVRELAKLLGGEVTLDSELGRGSTFTVRLPLQLSEEPRLEIDLAQEGIDLSKAQRVDVRMYAGATTGAPVLGGLGPASAAAARLTAPDVARPVDGLPRPGP